MTTVATPRNPAVSLKATSAALMSSRVNINFHFISKCKAPHAAVLARFLAFSFSC